MKLVEFLEGIREYLSGKKTYILSVLTALYGVLTAFNLITLTPAQETAIWALLAALFGFTVRAAINKV